MRPFANVLVLLAFASAATAPGALAQDPEVHTDPDFGSPAGALYEIPLERGRGDAAPLPGGGGTGAAAAPQGAAPASPIRSENGFGSSSTVPGAPSGDTADGDAPSDGGGGRRSDGGQSTDGGDDRGGGRPSASGGGTPAVQAAAATGSVSVSRSLLLLGLGAAVALMLALAARWAASRR